MKDFIFGLFFATASIACGSGPGNPFIAGTSTTCMANQTQECVCPGGVVGAQTCNDDGSGWGKCQCTSAPDNREAGADAPNNVVQPPMCITLNTPAVCDTGCTGKCDAATFDGTCTSGCSAMFNGKCSGTCKGICDGFDITGHCGGTCQGVCEGIATGKCQSSCTGDFSGGTCTGKCTGKCCS